MEVEFEIFQAGDVKGKRDAALALNPGDAALVVRYEFYRYVGALTPEGEADCGAHGGDESPAACGGLGDYVGAQIAGFNAVEPLVAVPEPGQSTRLALGLVGLAIGWRRRANSLGF